jgi:hypothetical protein
MGEEVGVVGGYISAVGLDGGYGVCLQNINIWRNHIIHIDIDHD